jgi:hypothetical protein
VIASAGTNVAISVDKGAVSAPATRAPFVSQLGGYSPVDTGGRGEAFVPATREATLRNGAPPSGGRDPRLSRSGRMERLPLEAVEGMVRLRSFPARTRRMR